MRGQRMNRLPKQGDPGDDRFIKFGQVFSIAAMIGGLAVIFAVVCVVIWAIIALVNHFTAHC